jgi:hypothetical protein
MAPKKATNKISSGRKPQPKAAANSIKNMNTAAANKWADDKLKSLERQQRQKIAKAAAVKPVGAKASNAVFSRGKMGGPMSMAAAAAAEATFSPLAYKAGQALGRKLKPLARKLDDALPGVNSRDEARRRKAKTTAASTKRKRK